MDSDGGSRTFPSPQADPSGQGEQILHIFTLPEEYRRIRRVRLQICSRVRGKAGAEDGAVIFWRFAQIGKNEANGAPHCGGIRGGIRLQASVQRPAAGLRAAVRRRSGAAGATDKNCMHLYLYSSCFFGEMVI